MNESVHTVENFGSKIAPRQRGRSLNRSYTLAIKASKFVIDAGLRKNLIPQQSIIPVLQKLVRDKILALPINDVARPGSPRIHRRIESRPRGGFPLAQIRFPRAIPARLPFFERLLQCDRSKPAPPAADVARGAWTATP